LYLKIKGWKTWILYLFFASISMVELIDIYWLKALTMEKFSKKIRRYFLGKFRSDLTAGLTVGMVVIPQGMAYAAIAGVNPIYGLFTAIIPTIIAALFGSFPYLVTGPTNPTALVTASVLLSYSNRTDYLEFVLTLAILAGLFKLILGILKLGSLTKYISNSVLVGFLTGAGVLIITGQLSSLLGITTTKSGQFWHVIIDLFANISNANGLTIAVSVGSIFLMILLRRINRKLPASLISIGLAGLLVYFAGWGNQGVRLVSDVGLPEQVGLRFHIPNISISDIASLGVSGAAVALFGLMETVSIAKAMSQMSGDQVDPSQEMIGQGLASFIGGFFLCMPSSGSPSRTVVNMVNGAKTRISAILSGLSVFIFLMLFSDLISYIPVPALAAVVVVSSAGLININLIEFTWQSSVQSRVVMILTFFSTLLLPLEYAIYMGILSTILIYLGQSSHINLTYILEDEQGQFIELPMKGIEKHNPQIAIVNIEGDLYFAAVEELRKQIEQILETDLKVLILRFRRTHLLGSTGVMALERLIKSAGKKGVRIIFCGLQEDIREPLYSAGVTDTIGEKNIFSADNQLYKSTQRALDKARDIIEKNNSTE
jgi:SulP family sulfate permease